MTRLIFLTYQIEQRNLTSIGLVKAQLNTGSFIDMLDVISGIGKVIRKI